MSQISPIAIETAKQASIAAAPKQGNPAVVGLAGFGLTTLMLQFHNLGLAGIGPVIWLGFFFGGLAQLIAGLQEQKMGNNFGYSAFTSFGCFWITLCAMLVAKVYNLFPVSKADVGWFLIAWTLYSSILWVASVKISKAMFFTFTTLIIGFVLLDLEHFVDNESLTFWAGVDLTFCALGAWYMMASTIFKDVFGRDVLPVGKPVA
ncbi:MAG TPA: acetate uptake transporter [Candidatus Sulfotelmatobacter sp.]|jgi:succinate-acetate transporter protein|nr:acetate uptake transporter [Candidatus Sulfotelmatobacter sp.]